MLDNLEDLLRHALQQQVERLSKRKRKIDPSKDYAKRLEEKALYRRLINTTDVAQDGLRFIWYFSQPRYHQDMSLAEWRQRIDREIIECRSRKSAER